MKKAIGRVSYVVLLVGGVFVGGKLWSLSQELFLDDYSSEKLEVETGSNESKPSALVRVGGVDIEKGQLDLGVVLHAFEGEVPSLDNTAYLASGFLVHDSLPAKASSNLRSLLLKEMVERSLLLRYLQQNNFLNKEELVNNPFCQAKAAEIAQRYGKTFAHATMTAALEKRVCVQRAVQGYFDTKVAAKLTIPDQQVEDYYKQNKEEFKFPDLYTVRQIVTREEIEAKRIRYRVKPHTFASYAKEHSITPEGEQGGLMRDIDLQTMPQVFQEVSKMRKGRISGILKSTYGFHIIMLLSKQKASQKTFEEVKDQIREKLLEEKKKEEYRKWVELALHSVSVGLSSQ